MIRNAQSGPHVARSGGFSPYCPLSLAVSQALAQTANVTLYGIVDVGAARNWRQGGR